MKIIKHGLLETPGDEEKDQHAVAAKRYGRPIPKPNHREQNEFMKIDRYSAKCKLCKAKWTTAESDRLTAYKTHNCQSPRFDGWLKRYTIGSNVDSAMYQLSCFLFEHIQITGHFNADVKCDGRCMGATGHNCECSCGGTNHGVGAAA